MPQGGRWRRARLEMEGGRGQPAATRSGVEEARRPQWNMSSTIKDILLEGSANRHNMKLNGFIRDELGDEWVVERNGNVTMGNFVLRPTMFIQEEGLLGLITALPSYQELKILLEAITKLHLEGVVSLEDWRDYERKDTVTSFARRKIKRVFNQVLTEEKRAVREEEERLRQVAEERARWERQQIKFTISTNIKLVLFRGGVRVSNMRLNDFLTMELGGRGVVDTNRSVLLGEFFEDPARYIRDAGVLNEIQASAPYVRMGSDLRNEAIFDDDVNVLIENDVRTLLGWSLAAAAVKAGVRGVTKQFLDAALEEVRQSMTASATVVLEGLYESLYNATWHYVVEVSGGEKTGMDVREGKPAQSWTYKKVGMTLERDDGVEQSGAAPPRLMVLTSEKGWPYSWAGNKSIRDCYVNCEVDRVWQLVSSDVTEWFGTHCENDFTPRRHALIGTPGIGKSMATGSYLLYQLLHYDVKKLSMVAYVIGDQSFLFDKNTQTVTLYADIAKLEDFFGVECQRGVKGYVIYDVAKKGRNPSIFFLPSSWGMIVLSSPNEHNFKGWRKQQRAVPIIIVLTGLM
ncbi:retrotransposon hot spot (RHS) protein, putative [Trypanosoma cruzi marinkellei]|uniref:Retrotransposon hot spot (RHS) protein, putative n=1 Tax=Trypanosoma cruzi marinkellei TaxID=85056 RepID=K2MSY4_TRYCR|nr:retrotransposon hot spot (RHS) protein, putative [Trypanosoma cruzi marinkellei]